MHDRSTLWDKTPTTPASGPKVAEKAKFDDPEVQAILREMMVITTGPQEMPLIPSGQLGVVTDGQGVWQIRNGLNLTEVTHVGKATLPFSKLGYTEGLTLHAPLPVWAVEQIGSLFRWVYQQYKAEAFARIFWQRNEDGSLKWEIVVPPQQVSGAGVKHETPAEREGWVHWGDVHSHGSMDTFWSSVDDNDEQRFEGCLFGVMGKWGDPWPKSKWRARFGARFIDLPLDTIVGGATVNVSGRAGYGKILDSQGKIEMSAGEVKIFPPDAFPEVWKEMIQENKGYVAARDSRQGSYSYSPSVGRGGTIVTPTGHSGGSGGYRNRYSVSRSPRQVTKLVKRITKILSGESRRGVSLFSADPLTAKWFVDDSLQVWSKASQTSPLVRVVTPLAELLTNESETPKKLYVMRGDADGNKK